MDSSVLSDDSDYDIVSPDNSIADLRAAVPEPPPSEAARETFNTARLSAQEIQSFVGLSVSVSQAKTTKRIYVDGIFDPFSVRCGTHPLHLSKRRLRSALETCSPTPPSQTFLPVRLACGRCLLKRRL